MNRFTGVGNLGDKPKLKTVPVGDEMRDVLELRIYFDRPVPDGEGYTDKGGFWLNANLWGNRAKPLSELLEKGMRVRAEGTLIQETWEDREGEERSGMKLDLDAVTLELVRVASIEMRQRESSAATEPQDASVQVSKGRASSRKAAA
ncbi:MAG: single-stranded DNA-binding protein [Panacagrimonas sp.]